MTLLALLFLACASLCLGTVDQRVYFTAHTSGAAACDIYTASKTNGWVPASVGQLAYSSAGFCSQVSATNLPYPANQANYRLYFQDISGNLVEYNFYNGSNTVTYSTQVVASTSILLGSAISVSSWGDGSSNFGIRIFYQDPTYHIRMVTYIHGTGGIPWTISNQLGSSTPYTPIASSTVYSPSGSTWNIKGYFHDASHTVLGEVLSDSTSSTGSNVNIWPVSWVNYAEYQYNGIAVSPSVLLSIDTIHVYFTPLGRSNHTLKMFGYDRGFGGWQYEAFTYSSGWDTGNADIPVLHCGATDNTNQAVPLPVLYSLDSSSNIVSSTYSSTSHSFPSPSLLVTAPSEHTIFSITSTYF